MCDAILRILASFQCRLYIANFVCLLTWRPSIELSVPPEDALMYGILVVGWMQLSFNLSIRSHVLSQTVSFSGNDVEASAVQSHILDDLRVCTRLKLEEHNVCDWHNRLLKVNEYLLELAVSKRVVCQGLDSWLVRDVRWMEVSTRGLIPSWTHTCHVISMGFQKTAPCLFLKESEDTRGKSIAGCGRDFMYLETLALESFQWWDMRRSYSLSTP